MVGDKTLRLYVISGSSSMASVCVGSLALMDAGVQLKEPAAGVAIGLIGCLEQPESSTILTDILVGGKEWIPVI